MPSRCNDRPLAHIDQGHAGAIGTLLPHIWQGTQANPSSQADIRDEAGKETAHQEEKTPAILDECERLAEAER
jgi:hypothetical protein